jgi:hypothetical protein
MEERMLPTDYMRGPWRTRLALAYALAIAVLVIAILSETGAI